MFIFTHWYRIVFLGIVLQNFYCQASFNLHQQLAYIVNSEIDSFQDQLPLYSHHPQLRVRLKGDRSLVYANDSSSFSTCMKQDQFLQKYKKSFPIVMSCLYDAHQAPIASKFELCIGNELISAEFINEHYLTLKKIRTR